MKRTETRVHGMDTLIDQRGKALARSERMLMGACFCAQLLVGSALHVLPRAASASWQAALVQLLPAGALFIAAKGMLARRGERTPGKSALLFLVPLLLDMQLSLLAICELAHDYILPESPRFLYALVIALCAGATLRSCGQNALPRLARLLRVPLIAAFAYCAINVIGKSDMGYAFPVLGRGLPITGRAALWLSGCAWVCALPAALKLEKSATPVRAWPAVFLPPALCAVLLFLLSILQPSYGLTRGMGLGARMLLLMELSTSALTWSLLLAGELFLFMLSFSGAARFAGDILAPYCKSAPCFAFPLLCVPLAALGGPSEMSLLAAIAPYRALIAAVALAALFFEEGKQ